MSDMLIKLYELPDGEGTGGPSSGFDVRRASVSERDVILAWVTAQFSAGWASECAITLARQPVSCWIAVENQTREPDGEGCALSEERLVGFACYDAIRRGMFGPLGVHEASRGRGLGRSLLLAALRAMAAEDYAYAVAGWVSSAAFYQRTVGATVIEGSEPGIFRGPPRGA